MAGTISNPALGVSRHRQRGVIGIVASITTDASGDASETVIGTAFGRLRRVLYSGGLDASAVITIKDVNTGATAVAYTTGTEGTPTAFSPTEVIATIAGAAVTAADTAPNVNRPIFLSGKVSLTVASGGNAETGKVKLIVDEAGLGDLALTV
jgi:hypothetical protein